MPYATALSKPLPLDGSSSMKYGGKAGLSVPTVRTPGSIVSRSSLTHSVSIVPVAACSASSPSSSPHAASVPMRATSASSASSSRVRGMRLSCVRWMTAESYSAARTPRQSRQSISFRVMPQTASRHIDQAEGDQDPGVDQVGPALPAEHRVADQLDAVVERVQLGEHLRPLGQLVDGEERARHQEERRQHGADDVAEVLERVHARGDGDPEPGPAEAGQAGDERDREHPPARGQPEAHRHEHRHAAVDAGPDRDPDRLRRDQLLAVTGAARIAS